MTEPAAIERIVDFMRERTLLIADGHHRYETSVAISDEFEAAAREQGLTTTESIRAPVYLCISANGDDPNLIVFPTHRLVHSLPSFEWLGFLRHLEPWFDAITFDGRINELRRRLADSGGLALGAVAKGERAALLQLKRNANLAAHPVLGRRPAVLRETSVALLHDVVLEGSLASARSPSPENEPQISQEPTADSGPRARRRPGTLLDERYSAVRSSTSSRGGRSHASESTFFYPKVITGLCFHTLRSEYSITAS